MKGIQRRPLLVYVLGTFAWTWAFWLFLAFSSLSHDSLVWKGLFVVGLSGPLVASTVVSFLTDGWQNTRALLSRLLIWRVSPSWYILALVLPPLLMLGAAGLGQEYNHSISLPMPAWGFTFLMFFWLMIRSGPVNEEVGWRGFLLPRLLERHSPFTASLILGAIWALWHLPLWFLTGIPHQHWPYLLFCLMVFAMTFLFTWFYHKTKGSLIIPILLHASVNTSIKFIPILPPEHTGLAPFAIWIGLTALLVGGLILLDPVFWFNVGTAPAERLTAIKQRLTSMRIKSH